MINYDRAKRMVNLLVGNVIYKADVNNFKPNSIKKEKILIVEGETDKLFIDKFLSDNVLCEKASVAFFERGSLSSDRILNNKVAIEESVEVLSKFGTIYDFPEEVKHWQVFGMIDLDFDEASYNTEGERLFVTDTHDLETLIMSTDGSVFCRIDKCAIDPDEVEKAYFMAYQLGRCRNLIASKGNGEFRLDAIAAGQGSVPYSEFIQENYKISLPKLAAFLNSNAAKPLSPKKLKGKIDALCKEKSIRKELDNDGCWKKDVSEFDRRNTEDFWKIVNGHDILSLIKFQNNEANNTFYNPRRRLNREFEKEIINRYDSARYYDTDIGKKMVAEELVKPD